MKLSEFLDLAFKDKLLLMEGWEEKASKAPPRIAKLIQYLIPRDTLLATFLLKAKYIKNTDFPDQVDTAAVTVRNGHLYFIYNPEFINKLPTGELIFVLTHELMHLMRHHLDRLMRQKLDQNTYNIAADMLINHTIKTKHPTIAGIKTEVPDWVYMPPKEYKAKQPNEKLWTAEDIYRWMLKNGKNPQPPQPGKPPTKKDMLRPGSIVRTKDGKLGQITRVNPDGTYEVTHITEQEAKRILGQS